MPGLYQSEFLNTLEFGVRALLPKWQLSPETHLSLLCISENATFRADDPVRNVTIVIRVHRPGYHDKSEIASELGWIKALRNADIVTTPKPVPTLNGDLIATFEHDGETRHAVAFEFLPGIEPKESGDLSAGFRQLGKITAQLHGHTRHWQRSESFKRKIWNFDTTLGSRPHWGDWRAALGLQPQGKAVLSDCIDLLAQRLLNYGTAPSRFGLIHADLRLANLLVDGDQLAVVDFDDCGFGWYMYDFAAAISFIETSPQIPVLQAAWMEGYQTISQLDDADINALPMFIILRRLLLTAWIASHVETPTAQQLGEAYTQDTVKLALNYLQQYG